MDQKKITVCAVTPGDVAALVKIHTAAFRSDQFSNLMLLNRAEDAHQKLMQKSVKFWMSDTSAQLIKAVDDGNGEVIGWACWVQKESTGSDAKERLPTEKPAKSQASESGQTNKTEENATKASEAQPQPTTPSSPDQARVLGGLMREDMVRWEETTMKGKTYMVLQALAMDPQYQGRGVGTRLVQWGIEHAQSLPCWIHASPASYSLYKRLGFQELGKSDYDLDEWAPGGKGGNRGWGRYTFRYMMRG